MIQWDWLCCKKPKDISLKKRVEEGVMLVYGKQLEICYLNNVGGEILELSDGTNTVDYIFNTLILKYDVDENELRSDIIDLIRELQWKRLVKLED